MKKLIIILLFIPFCTNAQKLLGGKNILKTNILGDAITNYNITYERSIAKKLSLSVGLRYMPKSTLPTFLKDKIESLADDKNLRLSDFQMGNFAITPELRLYLSAGKMKGFYIAPYVRYASFDMQVPMTYDYTSGGNAEKGSALFNGTITSFSGGLLLGTQFQIAKKLVLDLWIIGGHYGTSSGTMVVTDFSPAIDDASKRSGFDAVIDNINNKEYGPFKFKAEVDKPGYTKATITSTGAWAGVRALGLSLGVRF